MPETPRLPDFFIIGAGKSGTTTLYHWLAAQPEVFSAPVKEPHFFSLRWGNGLDWYHALYQDAAASELIGDASTTYSRPEHGTLVAQRLHDFVPQARLIYLLRNPVERLRSQYRHDRRRARVSVPLPQAMQLPSNPYVGRSLYYTCLSPYLDHFSREQICVVRFEDLVANNHIAWTAVLDHLGLASRKHPKEAHNVTAEQPRVTPLLAWLRDTGRLDRLPPLPRPVREWGKDLLLRRDKRSAALISESLVDIPLSLLEPIWSDIARLEGWLGLSEPLWAPSTPPP